MTHRLGREPTRVWGRRRQPPTSVLRPLDTKRNQRSSGAAPAARAMAATGPLAWSWWVTGAIRSQPNDRRTGCGPRAVRQRRKDATITGGWRRR